MKITSLLLIFYLIASLSGLCQSPSWEEQVKILPSERARYDWAGFRVGMSGRYAIMGASRDREDENGANPMERAGSAFLFERNNEGQWIEIQKIVALDREAFNHFGSNVAISGNYALIGAPGENDDASGGNHIHGAGAAYIFERDSTGLWNQTQKLVASDRDETGSFGTRTDIKGNYAIIGAISEDKDATGANPMERAGAAYIFKRDSLGNWLEIQKIVHSDRNVRDQFGVAVEVDSPFVVVGTPNQDFNPVGGDSLFQAGAVYIFEIDSSGQWQEVQKIVSFDRGKQDGFGSQLSLNHETLIVGAPYEKDDLMGGNSMVDAGSAYMFERDSSGIWQEVNKLVASDRDNNDNFGISVSLSGDIALVGSSGDDEDVMGDNFIDRTGSAYFFEKDSTGNWTEIQKIIASDRDRDDRFGTSVGISGAYAIISAPFEGPPFGSMDTTTQEAGAAYMFQLYCRSASNRQAEACGEYLSPYGTYLWNSSGIYADTLINPDECDSIIITDLTIYSIDTSVTRVGDTLIATDSAASYQWLDCSEENSPIPGATNQMFTPTSNGEYAVIINANICADTSSCQLVSSVSIEDNIGKDGLAITPNPTDGDISISLSQPHYGATICIRSVMGEIVRKWNFEVLEQATIELDGPTGLFFVDIRSKDGFYVVAKVLKL